MCSHFPSLWLCVIHSLPQQTKSTLEVTLWFCHYHVHHQHNRNLFTSHSIYIYTDIMVYVCLKLYSLISDWFNTSWISKQTGNCTECLRTYSPCVPLDDTKLNNQHTYYCLNLQHYSQKMEGCQATALVIIRILFWLFYRF